MRPRDRSYRERLSRWFTCRDALPCMVSVTRSYCPTAGGFLTFVPCSFDVVFRPRSSVVGGGEPHARYVAPGSPGCSLRRFDFLSGEGGHLPMSPGSVAWTSLPRRTASPLRRTALDPGFDGGTFPPSSYEPGRSLPCGRLHPSRYPYRRVATRSRLSQGRTREPVLWRSGQLGESAWPASRASEAKPELTPPLGRCQLSPWVRFTLGVYPELRMVGRPQGGTIGRPCKCCV